MEWNGRWPYVALWVKKDKACFMAKFNVLEATGMTMTVVWDDVSCGMA
jgi:hypothetical protein